jgi:hypothetical protein
MIVTANDIPSSLILFTLMMKAILESEASLLTRTTRRHIPEDGILYSHLRVKPQILHIKSSRFLSERFAILIYCRKLEYRVLAVDWNKSSLVWVNLLLSLSSIEYPCQNNIRAAAVGFPSRCDSMGREASKHAIVERTLICMLGTCIPHLPLAVLNSPLFIDHVLNSDTELYKVWGFQDTDYGECHMWDIKIQFVPHRKHIKSLLQSPAG